MQLSKEVERILSEFDDKFTATDLENGLPTYTQHPKVLRNWLAAKLHYYESIAKQ